MKRSGNNLPQKQLKLDSSFKEIKASLLDLIKLNSEHSHNLYLNQMKLLVSFLESQSYADIISSYFNKLQSSSATLQDPPKFAPVHSIEPACKKTVDSFESYLEKVPLIQKEDEISANLTQSQQFELNEINKSVSVLNALILQLKIEEKKQEKISCQEAKLRSLLEKVQSKELKINQIVKESKKIEKKEGCFSEIAKERQELQDTNKEISKVTDRKIELDQQVDSANKEIAELRVLCKRYPSCSHKRSTLTELENQLGRATERLKAASKCLKNSKLKNRDLRAKLETALMEKASCESENKKIAKALKQVDEQDRVLGGLYESSKKKPVVGSFKVRPQAREREEEKRKLSIEKAKENILEKLEKEFSEKEENIQRKITEEIGLWVLNKMK